VRIRKRRQDGVALPYRRSARRKSWVWVVERSQFACRYVQAVDICGSSVVGPRFGGSTCRAGITMAIWLIVAHIFRQSQVLDFCVADKICDSPLQDHREPNVTAFPYHFEYAKRGNPGLSPGPETQLTRLSWDPVVNILFHKIGVFVQDYPWASTRRVRIVSARGRLCIG